METRKHKILVLDDDSLHGSLLKQYLTEQGFQVEVVPDAIGLRNLMTRKRFDLLLLDLTLPGEDGMSVCRKIRDGLNSIPIIMLTAKSDELDIIMGLEMGADDYLTKPFNPRELVARMNAVLRRQPVSTIPGAPAPLEGGENAIQFGCVEFNLMNRTLTREGAPVQITSGDYALLRVLVSHPREPLSREKLTVLAKGMEPSIFDRSIDIRVSKLRRLIEEDSGHPRYIQTVWGLGYVFIPD